MKVSLRRHRPRTVSLPWEARRRWLRELASRRGSRLVVTLALLIFVTHSIWKIQDRHQRTRQTYLRMMELRWALELFQAKLGRCPQSISELIHPPHPSLPELHNVPRDGWGRTFHIKCPGRLNAPRADVISAGPSGSFLSADILY